MPRYTYFPSPKKDLKKIAFVDSLMLLKKESRLFSKEEFFRVAQGQGIPTGKLVYQVDGGYPLILNDYAETAFLGLVADSGYAQSIRGQSVSVPYVKPWAHNPSPYYPDFILYTYEGRIAFVEIKSILGMAQDENIAKFSSLYAFCERYGYLCAFIDSEGYSFASYLDPIDEKDEAMANFFYRALEEKKGFNENDLGRMKAAFPTKKESEIKRLVSRLILQDNTLENRYCHDDPSSVNATESETPLPYKTFH